MSLGISPQDRKRWVIILFHNEDIMPLQVHGMECLGFPRAAETESMGPVTDSLLNQSGNNPQDIKPKTPSQNFWVCICMHGLLWLGNRPSWVTRGCLFFDVLVLASSVLTNFLTQSCSERRKLDGFSKAQDGATSALAPGLSASCCEFLNDNSTSAAKPLNPKNSVYTKHILYGCRSCGTNVSRTLPGL